MSIFTRNKPSGSDPLLGRLRSAARPLTGAASEYDSLLDLAEDCRFVLLGEASHGTHEFYRERAEITKRLIEEKSFNAVAVEADWPDAYRINRFVQNETNDSEAEEALENFKRFPTWMWRNVDVLDFIGWVREHNDSLGPNHGKTGVYGLDLYSLFASMEAVLQYLDKTDPAAAKQARTRYACFDHYDKNSQAYGYAANFNLDESCQSEVLQQLTELRARAAEYARRDGRIAEDEFFFAEQNALLVKNAEAYYRSMFQGRASSWNLRDRHMAETLEALATHLERTRGHAKIVLWAHNSHLGDARATQMRQRSELNIGQLVREKHGDEALLVGFSTYHGTVTAASDWDEPAERKRVRPARSDSFEGLFHEMEIPNFLLDLRGDADVREALRRERLERAIGVIYRPETELASHYFYARLSEQFDVMLHFDQTRAVEPLERSAIWRTGEAAETYPSSL